MRFNETLIGDNLAEVHVRDNGGRWSVEVLTEDCRVFRLHEEFEVGGPRPTRGEVGRIFAKCPENFYEVI